MELISTVALLLTGITLVSAIPSPASNHVRSSQIDPDTGDCFAYNNPLDSFDRYEIKVGRPFIEGAGCDPIKVTLTEHIDVMKYSCKDDGNGGTVLKFIAGTGDLSKDNSKVLDAMRVAYPMITWGDCYVTPVKSAPLKTRDDSNKGLCWVYANTLTSSETYEIKVGRPFIDGAGCDPIKATLTAHIGEVTDYSCKDDGNGGTILDFSAGSGSMSKDNAKVMDALHEAYPMVDFDGDCHVIPTKLKARDGPIDANTAACSCGTAVVNAPGFGYCVAHIGRPFINGDGCNAVKDTLESNLDVTSYECLANQWGDTTQLAFTTKKKHLGKTINRALAKAYPDVPFVEQQYCVVDDE